MEQPSGYAIGQQDFKTLRQDNAIYVDKTQFVEYIANSMSKYYFLARPRRFGKSLFLSTLGYFFEGERHLFRGLHIENMDWGWEKYPVFHLDLNTERYATVGKLDSVLQFLFGDWERRYGIEGQEGVNLPQRFQNIIQTAYEKTGKQVVILVDEYDKPLVNNLDKREQYEEYRENLAALYSNFKTCARYIRLVFITGVSRFSKLTVFSGLNNLKDITFLDEFADICGITGKEIQEYLGDGLRELAEEYGVEVDEIQQKLKKAYDGYRFSGRGSDIYNPWSLLNCLDNRMISYYWNETGFPSIIAKSIQKINPDLHKLFDDNICSLQELQGLDLMSPTPIALMYQTGYLTIKDYYREDNAYRLGVPNDEVRDGLVKVLIPYFMNLNESEKPSVVSDIVNSLKGGRPDDFMRAIQTYFAGISYKMKIDNENNFHNAFFLLTNLIGLNSQAEFSTSDGSIDILIRTSRFIYVIELKYDGSSKDALRQINRKDYAMQFSNDSRKLFKIGVNFSSKTRRVNDWMIE